MAEDKNKTIIKPRPSSGGTPDAAPGGDPKKTKVNLGEAAAPSAGGATIKPAPSGKKTEILTPGRGGQGASPPEAPAAAPQAAAAQPAAAAPASSASTGAASSPGLLTVGWLVITDGPGRGVSLSLHYGKNSIGRGADQTVSIDFGDDTITRDQAASIIFDHKTNKFYLRDENARNNLYVNGDIVLQPTELKLGDLVVIGATTLAFVPFCGDGFSWESPPS